MKEQKPQNFVISSSMSSEISEKNVRDLDLLIDPNLISLKKNHVRRRIRARMLRQDMDTFDEYLLYVKGNRSERQALKLAFSINVTRFWRNLDTFELLQNKIIPIIRRENPRSLKIWSAGCADGAEPYTLSMICKSINLGPERIKILATDYNPKLLEIARQGIYDHTYLRETPKDMQDRYFENVKSTLIEKKVQVSPSLIRYIRFQLFDLIQDPISNILQKFDLILCRNVLIYFNRKDQELIYKKFYGCLQPGGFLVIGRSEILPASWRDKFQLYDPNHRVSRKL